MRLCVRNDRELRWIENFARQNKILLEEKWNTVSFSYPYGIVFRPRKNTIYKIRSGNYPTINDFIKCVRDDKIVVIYDGNIISGPYMFETEFEVNDWVEIIDVNQLYTTYYDWFVKNNVDINVAARYKFMDYGEDLKGRVGRIVAYGPTDVGSTNEVYCVEVSSGSNKPIYLINKKGIAFAGANE